MLLNQELMPVAATIITEPGLLRLLQLSSSTLPVGGYSFSLGLEYAVEAGWVTDLAATEDWLEVQLNQSFARVDLPIAARLYRALDAADVERFSYWTSYLLACRETSELSLTETAMGGALLRLLRELELPLPPLPEGAPASFTALFVWAGHHWKLGERACQLGLFWTWLEAQVAAAIKLVPLGQTDAQRLLGKIQEMFPQALEEADAVPDEFVGASMPGIASASAKHEHQYCRLFRS